MRGLKSRDMKDYVPVRDEAGGRMVGVVPDGYFVLHLGDRLVQILLIDDSSKSRIIATWQDVDFN